MRLNIDQQAQQCIDIALKAMDSKDYDKVSIASVLISAQAERMLEKSLRLKLTGRAQGLLSQLARMRRADASRAQPSVSPTQIQATQSRPRQIPEPTERESRAEQLSFCKKILAQKDCYQILGVARDAKKEAIEEAYMNLIIKLNPEESQVPQAEEAFTRVNDAFACLINPENRKIYDEALEKLSRQQPSVQKRITRQQPSGQKRIPRRNWCPSRLSNLISGFLFAIVRRIRDIFSAEARTMLKKYGPIVTIILLIFTIKLLLYYEETIYAARSKYPVSLERNQIFKNELKTAHLNQTYFVDDKTIEDFQFSSIRKKITDDRVEDEVLRLLKQNCQYNFQIRKAIVNEAKKYAAMDELEIYHVFIDKAEELDMAPCKTYKEARAYVEEARTPRWWWSWR